MTSEPKCICIPLANTLVIIRKRQKINTRKGSTVDGTRESCFSLFSGFILSLCSSFFSPHLFSNDLFLCCGASRRLVQRCFQAPVGRFQWACLLATDAACTSCLAVRQALPEGVILIEDDRARRNVGATSLEEKVFCVCGAANERKVAGEWVRAQFWIDVGLCRFVFCWLEMCVWSSRCRKGRS